MKHSMFKKLTGLFIATLMIAASFGIFDYANGRTLKADKNADEASFKIVSVSGEGIVSAEPNIAYVNLAVKTLDKDIKKAQEDNAKAMAKVVKEITALGIDKKDIQTTNYTINERYDWSKDTQIFMGYEIRNAINIKVKDIKKAGTVLDKGVNAGANIAGGISFDLENREELYNEALKMAMKSAEAKASAIMGSFGAKPGKPYRVIESDAGIPYFEPRIDFRMDSYKMKEDAADTNIEGGSLSVRATVNVEYVY